MSNDSSVYVGAVAEVYTGLKEIEYPVANYCEKCKKFSSGGFCSFCGNVLTKKKVKVQIDWQSSFDETEEYDEDSFCELPVEEMNKKGISYLIDNNIGELETSDGRNLYSIDNDLIQIYIDNFNANCGKALDILRANRFEVKVKFMYIEWSEY